MITMAFTTSCVRLSRYKCSRRGVLVHWTLGSRLGYGIDEGGGPAGGRSDRRRGAASAGRRAPPGPRAEPARGGGGLGGPVQHVVARREGTPARPGKLQPPGGLGGLGP